MNWLSMPLSLECDVLSLTCRKRTISEVQLMHNVQEHKQVGERQDWLQEKLKDIIVAASVKPQCGRPEKLNTPLSNSIFAT